MVLGDDDVQVDPAADLIAIKGGGYIMANCAFFDDVKPENVRTMVEFTKEYGVY